MFQETGKRMSPQRATAALALFFLLPAASVSADGPSAEELARKAQDPLADVKALMSDNTIAFGTADDQTSYGFQLQPVYSIPTTAGFNFIARGIVPIVGVQSGAVLPKLGAEPIGGSGLTWGLSDVVLQGFFVPKSEGGVKFGFGPQVSLRTRTDEAVAGPGWGGGLGGVLFGFAGDLSYGVLLAHHWGQDGYNLTTVQPIAFYNSELFGGSYVGYNNSITYDWSASGSNAWQVPVGLTVGKTFILEGGYMIDANLGGYYLAAAPDGGANAQLKFGLSLFFP